MRDLFRSEPRPLLGGLLLASTAMVGLSGGCRFYDPNLLPGQTSAVEDASTDMDLDGGAMMGSIANDIDASTAAPTVPDAMDAAIPDFVMDCDAGLAAETDAGCF